MKQQTMFRINKDKENPYVMLNKGFLNDDRLTWKSKGILAYLLSLPDDWQIYEDELKNHSWDNRTALNSGIKELIEVGYIERTRLRNEKGQLGAYEYCVHEVSTKNGFSKVGKTKVGKSATTNTNLTNNDLTNNDNNIGGKWVGIAKANTNKPLSYFEYLIKLVKTTDSEYKNEIVESVIYYYGKYQETFGESHIRYTEEYSYKIIEKLNEIFDVGVLDDVMTGRCDMDLETFKVITDKHFATEYKQMSPTLLSFLNDRVLIRRFYEECY